MPTTENLELARAWLRAFNAHDVDALVALYADDATHTSPKIRALHPDSGGVLRGKPALERWWRVALAAEMVGTMEAALSLTVAHLAERRQFGQPIGAFQAIQHRLAELHIGVEGARWMTRFAAARDGHPDAAAAAAASASMVADTIVRDTHQLSGAMGLTEEYDLYLWTMRLPALSLELGGAGGHEAALARARWIDAATPDAPASAPEEAR
jgi:hypothetical protein